MMSSASRRAGTMRFAGVLCQFDSGLDLPDRDELEAIGDRGSLFLSAPWHGWVAPRIQVRTDSGIKELRIGSTDPYQLELANLSDASRGAAEPLMCRAAA